jgi:ribosomal protein S18 acetylase RimI-like enzyme
MHWLHWQEYKMSVLVPMSLPVYEQYLDDAIRAYADENVRSGRWPARGAVERARADFQDSLPQGLATADNYLFEIRQQGSDALVGFIWFAVVEKNGIRSAFVYDVEIKAEFRRQGHASLAFQALEEKVRELGLQSIGLHVFAHNTEARALYDKLGYRTASLNMLKKLD